MRGNPNAASESAKEDKKKKKEAKKEGKKRKKGGKNAENESLFDRSGPAPKHHHRFM